MKTQAMYQVDAFADTLFRGNPAAVCILDSWLPDATMQAIAAENNLSETAFAVRGAEGYAIRWFTPVTEVALCGHATLATAHLLFTTEARDRDTLTFSSREKGTLTVSRDGEWLILDFPSDVPKPVELPDALKAAVGGHPEACFRGSTDLMLVYPDQEAVDTLQPDFGLLARIEARGVITTAPGEKADFVSRFFAPQSGVDEDPVTGSAHTKSAPYWAERLNKKKLHARQVSHRAGDLVCELKGDRVEISGKAITFMRGEIEIA